MTMTPFLESISVSTRLAGSWDTLIQGSTITAMVLAGTALATLVGLRQLQVNTDHHPHNTAAGVESGTDDLVGKPPDDDELSHDSGHPVEESERQSSSDDENVTDTEERQTLLRTANRCCSGHSSYTPHRQKTRDCKGNDYDSIGENLDRFGSYRLTHTDEKASDECNEPSELGHACCMPVHKFASCLRQVRSEFLKFLNKSLAKVSLPRRGLKWKITAICLGAYFSTGSIVLFDYMAPDFVGKAIYGGSPSEGTGSTEAHGYQKGIQMSAWSLLVYNTTFLVYSLVQFRVLDLCGEWGLGFVALVVWGV